MGRSNKSTNISEALDPNTVTTETETLVLTTTGAILRMERAATMRLVMVVGFPQHLCKPNPCNVYSPAGRKHILQNPLFESHIYK